MPVASEITPQVGAGVSLSAKKELPIFFDRTGRRWMRIKRSFFAILFLSGLFFYLLIPSTLRQANIPRYGFSYKSSEPYYQAETRPPEEIAYSLNRPELPIIGQGSLIRVVKIVKNGPAVLAIEPYSGLVTKELNDSEKNQIGKQNYAIEKYGKTEGKKIALTFDDGPDPVYTPQILDLLSRESVPGTFFAIGSNVAKYPAVAKRVVREGHLLANHTFNHVDFDYVSDFRAEQEINLTQRVIRANTGHNPAFFRLPYAGNDEDSYRDFVRGTLAAQRLGYLVTSFEDDTNDWSFKKGEESSLPKLDGSAQVVLLHDGGGNRTQTVKYLSELISKAKAQGYKFVTLDNFYPEGGNLAPKKTPSIPDTATNLASQAVLALPKKLIGLLFVTSIVMVFIGVIINPILASFHLRFTKYKRRKNHYQPFVSVIIPAYNEEKVLAKSVKSVLLSYYKNFEVIIVNDGSKDGTKRIIDQLEKSKRVKGLHQSNQGKAAAINYGISKARGDIIITIDADTLLLPQTITKFVRHFSDPSIGAVAGIVKVGNVHNLITRWQALEYTTSIYLERTAQATLGAIMLVPGACSAWKKEAVLAVGGYSVSTMAEDCDLTLAMRKAGYRVIQDSEAISFTESPHDLKSLAKQRFRWTFGNLQAFWKHRDIIFNKQYGWLGMFIIPRAVFDIILKLAFTPILLFVGIGSIFAGEGKVLVVYLLVSNLILFLSALSGLILARERIFHLSAAPMFRIMYSPMRTFLIYSAALTILRGVQTKWNRVIRTGTAKSHYVAHKGINSP